MIKEGRVPLDSLQFLQQANQVACYVCGSGNTYDTELCRTCFAPMALAHQAASQKVAPHLLATLGGSMAGKTVYLGMLIDMLSRQPERLQLLARGAFSINLQQTAVGALSRGEFPDQTPCEPDRWNWVHCQVQAPGQRAPWELIVPDLPGEAILEELDHPHAYAAIYPLLAKAVGAMVFVDTLKLQDGSLDEDYFTMKLLSSLAEIDDRPKRGWAWRPIAFVLTKADECEDCFGDPAAFAQSHAPGFWRHCRERFDNYRFFACGVAGACAYRITRNGRLRHPLRIEPRGIVEPFEWLVQQLKA
ncbi:MAG TPA: hypothetical protein VG125_30195 [Pirellulales bacterium]|jgi:hypothetical protein|nr:hypothetical protein [Pirellulales bacterium]